MLNLETLSIDCKDANILLVDDEIANTKLLARILQSAGYQNILITQDPQQTLPLIQEHHCDLLLLDINMPKMNGYQVMDQTIFMTASDIERYHSY